MSKSKPSNSSNFSDERSPREKSNVGESMPAGAPTSFPGILTDEEIAIECGEGYLISDDYNENQLKGCCYEFRVGSIAYTYDYEKKMTKQQLADIHIVHPFETLTVVTMETLRLKKDRFLFLFAKGSLFSIGLSPVCTAADPGFVGRLGITVTNLSIRPIQLKAGMSIAKGCFFRLGKEAIHGYVGQHGDATMSWPYPSQYHTEPANFGSADAEHWRFLPPPLLTLLSRMGYVEKTIKWIVIFFVVLVAANGGVLYYKQALPSDTYILVEKLLNIIGALASIVGLLLALSLSQKRQ